MAVINTEEKKAGCKKWFCKLNILLETPRKILVKVGEVGKSGSPDVHKLRFFFGLPDFRTSRLFSISFAG